MTRPSSQGPRRSHIPQKDLLVPANAGKAGVIIRDCEIEDFVAMCRVGLDES